MIGILLLGKRRQIISNMTEKQDGGLCLEECQNNGINWQVLMMINKVKTYIGCYKTEKEGALVYDIVSIIFKQNKARTNLSYSKAKLLDLLSYYDHESKHFHSKIPDIYLEELQEILNE